MHRLIFLLSVLTTLHSSAQCYLKENPSWGTPLSTTGSTTLDKILINEVVTLESYFKVKVKLFTYDDSNGPNALAIADYATILMGKTLMLDELTNTNNFNSIIAIMAHEFGHIVQAKHNMNSNQVLIGKYIELHADYLAGWYIGKIKPMNDSELQTVAESFYDKGDKLYFSEDHHGTEFERVYAFLIGHSNASKELTEAYNHGIKFVLKIEDEGRKVLEILAERKRLKSTNINKN